MTRLSSPDLRRRYLTVSSNNLLTVLLGLPGLLCVGVALATSALSDRAAFIGIVLIGAVY